MRSVPSLVAALLLAAGCGTPAPQEPPLFVRLPPEQTNVTFANTLADGPAFNIVNYLYYYDGGGVAAGDVNGDGLVDLYFTANEGPNRLYLNRRDPDAPGQALTFEDVTDRAGVAGEGNWTTGVSMADVDGDGLLDIYVSVVGGFMDREGRNQLFINDGVPDGPGQVPTFTERAAEYGLDFEGYGTHAVFFDYDLDGDLDAYLVNHSVHHEGTYGHADQRRTPHPRAGDRLYRNDPSPTGDGRRFTDVTQQAGIYSGVTGYGLSAVASDLDLDGCVDLYVANDFHENDYLYYNNCDGTFTEAAATAMAHTSLSSMGSDAADVDNDGLPDVVVLDMLPDREDVRKTSAGADPVDLYDFKRSLGYHHQLARNTFQLNRGGRRFSEIGALAGIEATDWSWTPLLADLDLDGYKDLFVTNGIYRRPNDLDYSARLETGEMQARLAGELTDEDMEILETIPSVPISNYAFRNAGPDRSGRPIVFEDRTAAWGLDHPGFSSGAAYADLDDDGDLDLVVNNVNAPASIYENRAADSGRHFLRVVLAGEGANTAGIGAKVMIRHAGRLQLQEVAPVRGYQSSVDPRLLFGLGEPGPLTAAPGDSVVIDSVVVVWPDARYQVLTDVAANRTLTLRQEDATGRYEFDRPRPEGRLFTDRTEAAGLEARHHENMFFDFNREHLIPHKLSTEGPALAVGDVDGDGLDDVYLGGAKHEPGELHLQRPGGGFRRGEKAPWRADSLHEDVDAAFFDAEGDGDLDLFVVSGGNEFWGSAEALRSRLYLNEGAGRFTRADGALPEIFPNGACVAPADFDGDGDVDLFLGARSVPWQYGAVPESYLLENDGRGRFTDVTAERAPALAEAGMVTDAAWTDSDGDGRLDLVVVGEWSPVRVFAQEGGRFAERTAGAGLEGTNGWWNAVAATDLDGDGDDDLVAGNLGLNALVRATPDEPARLYLNDFDDSGSLDGILTTYRHGTSYPVASVEMFEAQIPTLANRYPRFADFGARQVEEIFTDDELEGVTTREAYTFASAVAINDGEGRYTLRSLPVEAQFAPIQAILPGDYDGDGRTDLLTAGNFFGAPPLLGRYDAGLGLLLRGDGRGGFSAVPAPRSGLFLDGEVRALRALRRGDGTTAVLVARNDDRLLLLGAAPPNEIAGASTPPAAKD